MTTSKNLILANAMSDHNAQIDSSAKVVSQNLQGPYAIKPNTPPKKGFSFDTPEKKLDAKKLSDLSGLSEQDAQTLLDNRGQYTKEEALQFFKNKATPGLGDLLGQGQHRISIESDQKYKARMEKQVQLLIDSIEGGAEVLCFQEQPYKILVDLNRQKIFKEIMEAKGYVEKSTIEGRDVGIWVKKDKKSSYQIDQQLANIVSKDPFRGCAIQDKDYITVNLHSYTVGMNITQYTQDLLTLHNTLKESAKQNKKQLIIMGDLNLFQLNETDQKLLKDNGFTLEKVKGQETRPKPTYEAFLTSPTKKLMDTHEKHTPSELIKEVTAPSQQEEVILQPNTPTPKVSEIDVFMTLKEQKNLSTDEQKQLADLNVKFFHYAKMKVEDIKKETQKSSTIKVYFETNPAMKTAIKSYLEFKKDDDFYKSKETTPKPDKDEKAVALSFKNIEDQFEYLKKLASESKTDFTVKDPKTSQVIVTLKNGQLFSSDNAEIKELGDYLKCKQAAVAPKEEMKSTALNK